MYMTSPENRLSWEFMAVSSRPGGFQNKLVTAEVQQITSLHVIAYSGYSNQLVTYKQTCHSHILFQFPRPTSKDFEIPGSPHLYFNLQNAKR